MRWTITGATLALALTACHPHGSEELDQVSACNTIVNENLTTHKSTMADDWHYRTSADGSTVVERELDTTNLFNAPLHYSYSCWMDAQSKRLKIIRLYGGPEGYRRLL